MNADVVVIGAGPAGSSAAIRLARTGCRVTLYDKSRFPRPKLCGGYLSPEGLTDLEDLGILNTLRASSAPIRRTVIASPSGSVAQSPLPAEALSVSRHIMDDLLIQQARRAGVDVREGEDGFGKDRASAYTVIAAGRMAWGRDALPKRRFTPWYASPATPYFGIQALFDGIPEITDQIEVDVVNDGYVGLARQPDGINICALTTQATLEKWGPSLDAVMAHLGDENPVLRRHLQNASRRSAWMTVGPVRLGIRRLARERQFYIGDAACVVDPFVGEGMSIGLYSSRLLVKALTQTRENPADVYSRLWRQAFMPSLRWNAVMRLLYGIRLFHAPAMRSLQEIPSALNWLTELTRYRQVLE